MTTWDTWDDLIEASLELMLLFLSSSPQFSGLYIVSLVAILIGFITFNAVPTPSVQSDASSSSLPSCQESHTNPHLEPEEVAAGNAATCTENDGKAGEPRENWEGKWRASSPEQRIEESKINWNAIIEHSTKMWTAV